MLQRAVPLSTLLSAFALAQSATADRKPSDDGEAVALEGQAFDHFALEQYAKGIEILEGAYRVRTNPDFLLNIALAYDQWRGHCAGEILQPAVELTTGQDAIGAAAVPDGVIVAWSNYGGGIVTWAKYGCPE